MKKMIFATIFLSGFMSQACVQLEAQVIGDVTKFSQITSSKCHVYVSDLIFYNDHQICSLDKVEIQSEGVDVELLPGQSCSTILQVNGIVYKRPGGNITLEN